MTWPLFGGADAVVGDEGFGVGEVGRNAGGGDVEIEVKELMEEDLARRGAVGGRDGRWFVFCELCLASSYFTNYDGLGCRYKEWPRMRVISQSRLKQFWVVPGRTEAEGPLRAWYTHVKSKSVAWRSWGDVKASFASASLVGNCVVFNIGGNKYRMVTRILYTSQKVFVLKVLTHAEYDQNKWQEECGCYEPPPKSAKGKAIKRPPRGTKGN